MPISPRGGRSDWPQERPRPSQRARDKGRSYPGGTHDADDDGYDFNFDDRYADEGEDAYRQGYRSPGRSGSRHQPAAGQRGRSGGRYDESGADDDYDATRRGSASRAPEPRSRPGGGQSRLSDTHLNPRPQRGGGSGRIGRSGGSYEDDEAPYATFGGYGETRYGQRGPSSGGRAGYGDTGTYSRYGDDNLGAAWSAGQGFRQGPGQGQGQVYGADYYRQGASDWQGGNVTYTMPPANDPIFGYEPDEVAEKKSRRNRVLTVVLSVLVVLGLLGGGAVFVLAQYAAPAAAVGAFCGELQTKQYASAYGLLGGTMRAVGTGAQFAGAMANLDAVEGAVTRCGLAPGASFSYRFLGSVASADLTLTRATAGTLSGAIHLTNQDGAWRLDQIDNTLFGVSLGAAGVFSAYCADVVNQRYDDAYSLFTAKIQSLISKGSYMAQEQVQDQLDGKVGDCHLTGIGKDATDDATTLSASITRATLGERKGTFALNLENGAWKVARIEAPLLGTDLGPFVTMARFCHDLAAADYHDAYGLFTTNWTGGDSEAGFTSIWNGQYNGVKWDGCDADSSTYTVNGNAASMVATFSIHRVDSQGSSGSVKFKVLLVGSNGVWKIDDWQRQ